MKRLMDTIMQVAKDLDKKPYGKSVKTLSKAYRRYSLQHAVNRLEASK